MVVARAWCAGQVRDAERRVEWSAALDRSACARPNRAKHVADQENCPLAPPRCSAPVLAVGRPEGLRPRGADVDIEVLSVRPVIVKRVGPMAVA